MSTSNLQWGSPAKVCNIEIDKKSIAITKSLDTAIRHLRHEEDSVMIWVEQVCINQNDLAERDVQIPLMSLIYSRALNTVIWLGDISADDAFDALHDLESTMTSQFGPLLDESKPKGLEAIERLFNAPWFQRTWTTQEACLSNDAWLMAGTSICHWEDCFGSAAVNERLGLFHPTPTRTVSLNSPRPADDDVPPIRLHGFHCANAIWEIKHTDKSSRKIMDVLVKTRHTQATMPVDNIYGVLGLLESDIDPSSRMTATELWRSISLRILKTEIDKFERMLRDGVRPFHDFSLLSCVDHGVDGSGDLPSWTVDWSKSRVTTSLAYSTSAVNCFDAGQSSTGSSVLGIDQHGRILTLRAKVFDTLAHLSAILDDADLKAAVSDTDNAALRTCIAYAKTVPVHCPVQLSFLGFCKVVTAGKDGSGRQKYPHEYTEILSFLSDALTRENPTFHDQPYTSRQQKGMLAAKNLQQKGMLTADNLKTRTWGRTFKELQEAFKSAVLNRRLCWTKEGHLGLVPRFAKQDDYVVVVPGSPVPFVVRRVDRGDGRLLYRFIGECYVDGIMNGEVVADEERGLRDLDLV